MPIQEPQHYWPYDAFPTEPAKEADAEPVVRDENTVTPFIMRSGSAGSGRDLLFDTRFFEVPSGQDDPKAVAPEPGSTVSPQVTNQSLGEDSI